MFLLCDHYCCDAGLGKTVKSKRIFFVNNNNSNNKNTTAYNNATGQTCHLENTTVKLMLTVSSDVC